VELLLKSLKIGVKEEKSEECYAIPDWETLELPKPVLRRLRVKPLSWFKKNFNWADKYFNEQRCENFDMVATYRPYHFNGTEFGLYIYARFFAALLINILETTGLSLGKAHAFALECVQSHGAFHYLVERYAERGTRSCFALGRTSALSHYPRYKKEVYAPMWGTQDCIEETLANVYLFQNHPEWDEEKRRYVLQLYARQRDGYGQAAELEPNALSAYYTRLEKSIGGQGTQTLEQWIRLQTPFRADRFPIYLVNDDLENSKFEEILEIIFPSCLEFEPQSEKKFNPLKLT